MGGFALCRKPTGLGGWVAGGREAPGSAWSPGSSGSRGSRAALPELFKQDARRWQVLYGPSRPEKGR